MAYTEEQAVNHVIGKGFSHKAAQAIVDELGPQNTFEGAGKSSSSSGEARAHVESFGYSREAAQKIVDKVEPHIVLAHKQLADENTDPDVHSFWDPNFGEAPDAKK